MQLRCKLSSLTFALVKCISTILSLYLMALAVLPCSDESGWCLFDIEAAVGVELHETDDHDHQTDCSDHCSPFCICNCCQITVRTPVKTAFSISPPSSIIADQPQLKPWFKVLILPNDIWQPPKLT